MSPVTEKLEILGTDMVLLWPPENSVNNRNTNASNIHILLINQESFGALSNMKIIYFTHYILILVIVSKFLYRNFLTMITVYRRGKKNP